MSTLSSAGIAYAKPDWQTDLPLTASSCELDALARRWSDKDRFTIAETGFGSGMNFLITVEKWLATQPAGELHYIGIENAPWLATEIERALALRPELEPLLRQLLALYPPPLRGWQRLPFPQWRITLDLLFNDTETALSEVNQPVDAWHRSSEAAASDGIAKSQHPSGATAKSAVVIGAGLAGSGVAAALARRGVAVTVLDALPTVAAATSGNPVAALQGRYHRKQDHLGRWSQAASRRALTELSSFSDTAIDRQRCGSIHLLSDTGEQTALAAQLQLPASVGQWLTPAEASQRAGIKIPSPALWQPEACVINPAKLTLARLSSSSDITTLCDSRVASLQYEDGQWCAIGNDGAELVTADIAILATGAATGYWLPWLPLQLARGQLTAVTTAEKSPFTIVGYGGQLMPPKSGRLWLGATAVRQPLTTEVLPSEHATNIERLAQALPELYQQLDCSTPVGRAAIRCKYLDHLPLAGEIDSDAAPGLYLTAAHGARGVSNSSLCGEIIAGLACGIPPARSLVEAVAPVRAWQRHMHKSPLAAASPLDGTPIRALNAK